LGKKPFPTVSHGENRRAVATTFVQAPARRRKSFTIKLLRDGGADYKNNLK
jgi:hypothetical protein